MQGVIVKQDVCSGAWKAVSNSIWLFFLITFLSGVTAGEDAKAFHLSIHPPLSNLVTFFFLRLSLPVELLTLSCWQFLLQHGEKILALPVWGIGVEHLAMG